jgi:radical SAM protein with 4Fe4S-binding SPASM domain
VSRNLKEPARGQESVAAPRLQFVNVELTLRCNHRCLHCGSTAGRARDQELDAEQWTSVMHQLAELGCTEVCLLGGEPVLFPAWFRVAEAICDLGMDLVLITNGWLVNPRLVRRLKRLKRLVRIGVSLDGATAETHDRIRDCPGSFSRAAGALRMLAEAGFEVGAITSVSKLNLTELSQMRDILLGQNMTWQLQTVMGHGERWSGEWNLTPEEHYQVAEFISKSRATFGAEALPVTGSHDFGYNSGRLSGYAELPDWHGCAGGIATLGICSTGGVKPCLSQPDYRIVGDLRTETLQEIWSDDNRFRRTRQFRLDMLGGLCRSCPYAEGCRGGCPNLPLSFTGADSDNPFCLYRLERQGCVPPDPLEKGWIL